MQSPVTCLTIEQLEQNYKRQLNQLCATCKIEPLPFLFHLVDALRVTHTFPSEKFWGNKTQYPYKEILFETQKLLSSTKRRKIDKNEPTRDMDHARDFGLDNYVFAYLGRHQPYYATLHDATSAIFPNISYPFGIFIKRECEVFPKCNASRRDLASNQITTPHYCEFFLPQDARSFVAYQIMSERHNKDAWHYWGAARYSLSDEKYNRENWQWLIEFHFLEELSIENIEAILWPIEKVFLNVGFGETTSVLKKDASEFREKHPGCCVIEYDCDLPTAGDDFIRASCAVTRFFIEEGQYPESAFQAIEKCSGYCKNKRRKPWNGIL